MTAFTLDPQLAADTVAVTDLSLCSVRLMRDARYLWLVLVPRRAGLVEIADLAPPDRALLMEEAVRAGEALRQIQPCDKLNIAALGNMVRQLHVHVIARRVGDAAWPQPVWGRGERLAYDDRGLNALVARLARDLST